MSKPRSYVPPHLRNQNSNSGETPPEHQGGQGEGLRNGGISRDNQSLGGYGRGNGYGGSGAGPEIPGYQRPGGFRRSGKMPISKSMPAVIQKDEEIEAMFEANKSNSSGPDISVYEGADVQVISDADIEPIKDFPRCGVHNSILANVAKHGYTVPTPVQRYSISYTLDGKDLIVTSQTGSGKTAAFMLPVCTKLLSISKGRDPSVCVLCPTRELAIQIFEETRKFVKGTEIKSTCVFGGAPMGEQIRNLGYGCDIVIATPGRLIDIMKGGFLSLSSVRFLILDEADRMLDMGFEPQMQEVINGWDMPPPGERQTMLFSATFPTSVQNLARDFMRPDVSRISVGMQDAPRSIEQRFIYCTEAQKFSELLDVIHDVDGPTLVFAERKVSVDRIEEYLFEEGTAVVAIHGDRQMNQRLAALNAFTRGDARIMVATDVAARGLDISNVAHVINLDLPTDLDTYTHRIGRTGRAGKKGCATSFFNESNNGFLSQFVAHIKQKGLPLPQGLEQYEQSGMLRRGGPQSRGGGGYGGGSRGAGGYGGNRGGGGYGGAYARSGKW